MSDAIREAIIDVLCSTRPMTAPQQADLIMAALQSSQTAPAVPELRELVKQYRDAVDYSHEVRRNSHSSLKLNVALAGQETIERQIDAMLAAPQPDHSPDAGKVVRGEA